MFGTERRNFNLNMRAPTLFFSSMTVTKPHYSSLLLFLADPSRSSARALQPHPSRIRTTRSRPFSIASPSEAFTAASSITFSP